MVLVSALVVMLLAAIAAPVLDRFLGRATGYPLSAVFLGMLVWLLAHAGEVLDGGTLVESYQWVPTLDVSFTLRMDGLALLFIGLVLGVGALVMSYTPQYLRPGSHARLFTILTLFAAAMLGLVLAGDLILLLVFWEVTTLCSFLLIAGQGTVGAWPATRALVLTGAGGLALLGAVVVLAVVTGTTDLATVIATAPEVLTTTEKTIVAGLIIFAAITKSAQVPVHFWLPDAMVAITPVSAYLHAATLVKAGIYLLLRTSPMFADEYAWHLTLMTIGLTTAVFGAIQALRQHDLKSLLAYSTVSQLGFIIALVGVGTTASLAAATLMTAAHALFKATLFMLVGIIDREAGSRDVRELSGLRRVMPITAALTALAALSMAGVPPLVGFVAKEEAFYAFIGTSGATWSVGGPWLDVLAGAIAVAAAAFTFAYSMRILIGAFGGPVSQPDLYDPSYAFLLPAAIPAVLGLVLGLVPQVLNPLIDRAVVDTGVDVANADLLLWHGFTPALAMSAAAITFGIAIYRWGFQLVPVLNVPTNPRGPVLFDRLWAAALELGHWLGRPRGTRPPPHLIGAAAAVVAVVAVGVVVVAPVGPMLPGTSRPADWVVLAVLLPAIASAAVVGRTVAALVLVGVIGFALSVWLVLLGAPDVALTLLLVEILTVVVAVPVLRGRTDALPRSSRRSTLSASAMAVAIGLAAGGAAWLLTGRRERSVAGDYLVSQAETDTGGANVVNTVLVDYRGLDTLGEIVVLFAAAAGLAVLLGRIPPQVARWFTPGESQVLAAGATVIVPALVVVGAVLFWRGHDEPGGGFIAGLTLGLALVVVRLARWQLRLPRSSTVLALGVGIATTTGLVGLAVAGSFLEPIKVSVPLLPEPLTSSLLFDLGVVLVVLGLVQTAIDRLEAAAAAGDAMPDTSSEAAPDRAGHHPGVDA